MIGLFRFSTSRLALAYIALRVQCGLAGSAEAAHRLGVKKVLPKLFTRKERLSAVHESIKAAE